MKTSLLLAAAFVLCSVAAMAAEPSSSGTVPSELSLLYKNTDLGPGNPVTNLNIRPDFKLVNNTSTPIAYSRIKVRYWFTQEQQYGDALRIFYTYASMGQENLLLSAGTPSEPRDKASRYVEFGFTAGAGELGANATTTGWIRVLVRNSYTHPLNEANDYSYLPPSSDGIPNDKMTVYLDDVLVYGTEPAVVPAFEDLRVDYAAGATGSTQIMMLLHFQNMGNTPVALADIKLRYYFSENDQYPLRYIEHYVADPTQTQGTIYSLSPAGEGADHYLDLSFVGSPQIIGPYVELRGFKLKIVRGPAREDFTDVTDDYSYLPNTSEYDYKLNEHITLYVNGQLVWGIEPPEAVPANARAATIETAELYPLPAKTVATLKAPMETSKVGKVTVVDLQGRTRTVNYTIEEGQIVFDVTSLERGLYSVNAEIDRKVYRKRLVVD
jgi:hypothetical protein